MSHHFSATGLATIVTAMSLSGLLAAGCTAENVEPKLPDGPATFVGSDQCESCHQQAYSQWEGSHHQLAMRVASPETVLGDFDDTRVTYAGSTSRFSKRGDTYVINTDDGSGTARDFEISYTFGVTPLQQYLVEFPGGRKQALPFAWDARDAGVGGQRWYSLYPDDAVDHNDPLHWTGRYYNWNFMCAECHSTNLRLGYDISSNTFDTTYDEISVGCEACHGPGSTHVSQASDGEFDAQFGLSVDLDDKGNAGWIMDVDTGIARRSIPNLRRQQPESCGRCHSRRSVIAKEYEYGRPLADTHRVSLLDEHLYHADGRILDEVYVYGSFLQSRMYAAGVTCTDCHNPHSGQLHAGTNPNDTCARCHLTTKFAAEDHAGEPVGQCVDCHMPAKTYMGVDDRRDHSFRLPNTSTDPGHYGNAIAAGRAGGANRQLRAAIANASYPAIARATLLTLLEPDPSTEVASLVAEQVLDPEPLVRVAALRAMRDQGFAGGIESGSGLLRDAVRAVRVEAALTYAGYVDLLPAADARAFNRAADEYREALHINASMPDAAINLAEFESRMGNAAVAAELYAHALRVGPDFAPAHHAYGLSRIRAGQTEGVLDHLRRATELAPEVARYAYVYGVALNSLGRPDDAVRVLSDAHRAFENDFDIGWALATIHRDRGEHGAALAVAEDLGRRFPGRNDVSALIESLR